ncbi:PLP-dependent aminotransferase family protein [Asaia bogorensis]|uniref:MocR-like pyridoxine biosynthesis transcription factor PdxR n=1 Tax=Asaia bogorensis TaxID=91915 RepID=UPI000EFB336E|nr:PLP-dependent aminotransferase family protein [Asaia bogorensis]
MPVYLPALFSIDPHASDPLPVQLFAALGRAIKSGKLGHGEALPSTRQAAAMLGLSRSSVATAYDLLRAEGILDMRAGRRPVVHCTNLPSPRTVTGGTTALSDRGRILAQDPRAASYQRDTGRLSPGVPDEAQFPADLWAQTLRRVARHNHGDEAAYGGYHGAHALREAISTRLASDRGLRVSPGQIIITPGTQASLTLIAQVMTDPGDVIAVEDPGYLGARASFMASGARIVPIPVDDHGMQVSQLPREARLVYITPSNQFPLGGRMGLDRRLALLDRARAQNALILEDDYDSEFLWHGREIAALAAHGTGCEWLYLGSASKALLPGLRLGWMAVPEPLVAPLRAAHRTMGLAANLHAQLALAALMETGQYRAHLRRIARLYQQRGMALYHALSTVEGLHVTPPHGGVQIGAILEHAGFETACLTALSAAGYRMGRLSALCQQTKLEGLIMGFASLREDDPARLAALLRGVLEGAPGV